MGGKAKRMRAKEKRPSRQAMGRTHRSNEIVARNKFLGELAVAAVGMLVLLGSPYVIHAILAPMKGWM